MILPSLTRNSLQSTEREKPNSALKVYCIKELEVKVGIAVTLEVVGQGTRKERAAQKVSCRGEVPSSPWPNTNLCVCEVKMHVSRERIPRSRILNDSGTED